LNEIHISTQNIFNIYTIVLQYIYSHCGDNNEGHRVNLGVDSNVLDEFRVGKELKIIHRKTRR